MQAICGPALSAAGVPGENHGERHADRGHPQRVLAKNTLTLAGGAQARQTGGHAEEAAPLAKIFVCRHVPHFEEAKDSQSLAADAHLVQSGPGARAST